MLQLTPQTIRIVNIYEDGFHSRHFTFEPVNFSHEQAINIGQFFMLSVPGAGHAPFTFTSLPDEQGRFNALVRRVGKLTNKLFEYKEGDLLGYNGPHGQGWPQHLLNDGDVLIVAGGCGLAPLADTIDYIIETGRADHLTLIYGSHDAGAQVLKREREKWKSSITLFETLSVTNDKDHMGRTTQHIQHVLNEKHQHPKVVLTCGPEAMMKGAAQVCMDIGIECQNIYMSIERRMQCGSGLCGHCYIADSYACKQGPTYRYDKLLELEQKTMKHAPHEGAFKLC